MVLAAQSLRRQRHHRLIHTNRVARPKQGRSRIATVTRSWTSPASPDTYPFAAEAAERGPGCLQRIRRSSGVVPWSWPGSSMRRGTASIRSPDWLGIWGSPSRVCTTGWPPKRSRPGERPRGSYGSPRVWADLRHGAQIRVGRKRVERLMRQAGLRGVTRRRKGSTTRPNPDAVPADDLVARRFTVDGPDQLWVADITEHPPERARSTWRWCWMRGTGK